MYSRLFQPVSGSTTPGPQHAGTMKETLHRCDDLAHEVFEPDRLETCNARHSSLPAHVVDTGHGAVVRQGQHHQVRYAARPLRTGGRDRRRGTHPTRAGAASRTRESRAQGHRRSAARSKQWHSNRPRRASGVTRVRRRATPGSRSRPAHRQPEAARSPRRKTAATLTPAVRWTTVERHRAACWNSSATLQGLPPCARAAWRTCRYSWPRRIISTNSPGCA